MQGAKPAPQPKAEPAPKPDRRWTALGEHCYLQRGRTCRFSGCWRSDYWFDVVRNGEARTIRITLPERLTGGRDGRVTEAERMHTVLQALRDALAQGQTQVELETLLQVPPDK